jgi:hypothetical protein
LKVAIDYILRVFVFSAKIAPPYLLAKLEIKLTPDIVTLDSIIDIKF